MLDGITFSNSNLRSNITLYFNLLNELERKIVLRSQEYQTLISLYFTSQLTKDRNS